MLQITLTVDCKADGLSGAGVEVRVLCQAGVVAGVHAEDLGDGVLWAHVDLGVVVEPDILAGWVGLSLAE